MEFSFRALEMHGRRMWERARILEALDFIAKHGMNALVLHESDLIHQLIFPRSMFDPYAQWSGAPARRGENAIQNNRIWFDHVLRLTRSRGVEPWIEVKELAFPDEVLESEPCLVQNGVICPSDPFWVGFIARKTEELLSDFPALAGIVLSPGSPEGRAARAQNKCGCTRCAALPLVDWYDGIIRAMHDPLMRAGKRLAVRDFAYRPSDHAPLIAALDRQPADVIFCIKATPHDFYPTFPHNPAITQRGREQWVEYDAMGQFYGWGVFPCIVLSDLRSRLTYARGMGLTGSVFRAEWERVNDWWALESLNAINMIGAAMLARDPSTPDRAIYEAWLAGRGLPPSAASWLESVLAETWPIISGALYIDRFVFADCSMFPRSIGRAWWTMEKKHSLIDWAPEHGQSLILDGPRIAALLTEKEAAHARACALTANLSAPAPSAPERLRKELAKTFSLLPLYVEGMWLAAEVCLRTRWAERDPAGADRSAFAAAVAKLSTYRERIAPLAHETRYPHQLLMLIDHRRIADILAEATRSSGTAAAA